MGGWDARNRIVLALLARVVLAAMLWGCRGDEAETPKPTLVRAMKGYELYSWFEGPGWDYALVAGTNRIKTYDEIAARDVRVEGIEALKDELARLPEGERVFWSDGRVPGTTLPPAKTVDEVRAFCNGHGIQLVTVGVDG